MIQTLTVALLSALIISAVSFIGAATLFLNEARSKKFANLLLAFAAGAMLGNALLHLLPHALEHATRDPAAIHTTSQHLQHGHKDTCHSGQHKECEHGKHDEHSKHSPMSGKAQPEEKEHSEHEHSHPGLSVIAIVLCGFFALYGVDLTLLSLTGNRAEGVRPIGYLVLISDGLENFIDGLVIGAAYLVSIPAGIAATVAIFLHELPIELGDFAILTNSGFSKRKALLLNFLSACLCLVGVSFAVVVGSSFSVFSTYATPFAAGAILYLASSGLLPQIRMEGNTTDKAVHFAVTLFGVGLMALLLFLE